VTVFETDRLVVRRWAEGDVAGIYDIYAHRAVARWIDRPVHASHADSERASRRFQERYEREDPARSWWALVERQTGAIVGNGGVHPVLDGAETEVGYHIAPAQWGRGFATEYARGAIRYGLQTLGLPRVIAVTVPTNLASQRVMVKAGMRRIADVDFQGYWSVQFEATP
jgi:RimJ/RimL family protein N-acetyltransferase